MSSQSYSNLKGQTANFNEMLKHFGIVTVMNAKVFEYTEVLQGLGVEDLSENKCDEILAQLKRMEPLCELKTLKVANVTLDGPSKTVTGGQYANPLIKFGKTATMEIQDALGNAYAIEALGGGLVEHFHQKPHSSDDIDNDVLHIGSDFSSAKTILGESFFIDQKTGQQVKVNIIFYQFLPDSLFNLTQDSEGDASVFDMNGSLLTTDIYVGDDDTTSYTDGQSHGVFYSIVSPKLASVTSDVVLVASKADGVSLMVGTTSYTNNIIAWSIDNGAVTSGTGAECSAAVQALTTMNSHLEVWYTNANNEVVKAETSVTEN